MQRSPSLEAGHDIVDQPLIPLPLVGSSEAAHRGREAFQEAVARRSPVLIVAEPGCRAGEVAKALHEATRPAGPFVAIDCGAWQPPDLARQLFGAADPAPADHDLDVLAPEAALLGASAGTLFIDHLDDMPASSQRRLSRVLRDGEVLPAGAARPVPLTCRVVGATTRDLEADVREGRFRGDLLRRFHHGEIRIPALRHRPSDLAAIVERLSLPFSAEPRTFTQPALTVLAALPWTRNIDQLEATLAAVLSSAGPVVRQEDILEHLPIDGAFARFDFTASLREARRRFERDYIAAVLERHQWRMSDAARTLGIERANLYRKVRQLGISRVPRAEES